jgi:hypothetical protein
MNIDEVQICPEPNPIVFIDLNQKAILPICSVEHHE